MNTLWCLVAALAVALCWYSYRCYRLARERRQRRLRERVAYLLWMVAQRVEGDHEMRPEDEEAPLTVP